MPSKKANKETIKYGDRLLLLNQHPIPDNSTTAGYLDTWGFDKKYGDNEKSYGVRTSQDPDRDRSSGTWLLVASDGNSDQLKYGHKLRLSKYQYYGDGQVAGYLEAFEKGGEIHVCASQQATSQTWQIESNIIKDNEDFVQNGDRVKLVQQFYSTGGGNKSVYLDAKKSPETDVADTYLVKTSQEANDGSKTWQIIRRSSW